MRSTRSVGASGTPSEERSTVGNFFFLGGHDAFERGVAGLVDAGLDREDGGQRQLDPLKPSRFEFALQFHAAAGDFDLHDDRGVRTAEQFGEKDAGLAEALIVALQAGEDEIEIFFLDGGGQRTRRSRADRV